MAPDIGPRTCMLLARGSETQPFPPQPSPRNVDSEQLQGYSSTRCEYMDISLGVHGLVTSSLPCLP